MFKILFISLLILLLSGCNNGKNSQKYDGKKLLESQCISCHNLNIPPIVSDDELAPPMMAVAFHVHNFVKPSDESRRTSKAVEFVVDYIFNPSLKKSFCDKKSLARYGLMPSQKENLTVDEAKAIAEYMFLYFTQKNLTKIQDAKAEFDAMPAGKKIALKYRCLGCHKIDKKTVGPSLKSIANKYKNLDEMQQSVRDGSIGKWKASKGAVMPAFKKIPNEDLVKLTQWIQDL